MSTDNILEPVASPEAQAVQSGAQRVLAKVLSVTNRLTTAMSYASGALLLALGLFMTFDVLGRRFGGPFSGATDEIASYAMAFSATWALAFTLATGRHIRIDVLLPMLRAPVRRFVDYLGIALLGLFAGMLAYAGWDQALDSHDLESRSMVLQVPIAIPQAFVALGFTVLALQALAMLLMAPFRDLDAIIEQPEDDEVQGI